MDGHINLLALLQILIPTENINASIMSLLSGTCEEAFGQELGYTHYGGVHTFENSTSLWSAAWGGLTPMQTNEDSFCGQHSLHVCIHILLP